VNNKKCDILVIDDNDAILKSLKLALKHVFNSVTTLRNPNQLISTLNCKAFDVILLDMNFTAGLNTGNEGLFWLNEILKQDQDAVVIMITAYGDISLAVKAIKRGAFDFIQKPWDEKKLIATLSAAYQLKNSKKKIGKLIGQQQVLKNDMNKEYPALIGESNPIKELFKTLKKVAPTEANILITGENGTGKELVAHEIHRLSLRKHEIMFAVDLGSLTETLFESEMFGHIKGAFTDAKEARTGKFIAASGGTIFLDEIGNLSSASQAKLLTVIQNKKVTPVGGTYPVESDVRIIAATNQNLQRMATHGDFREDLLFRLNTVELHVPALRYRGNDILLLADHFLKHYCKKYRKKILTFSDESKDSMLNYSWPGNVRELQHTMEKAAILTEGTEVKPSDINLCKQSPSHSIQNDSLRLDEVEKTTIMRALQKYKGNISRASQELGITRRTLYLKIEKYELGV
jgi:DNA-binding NtrC family response regulator